MLERPRMLVVVGCVQRRPVARLDARAEQCERVEIALTHDCDARLEEQRRRNADTFLKAPYWNQATAIGNYLRTARRAHIGQNRELDIGPLREGEHCSSSF